MKCSFCKKNLGKMEDKNYAIINLYIGLKQRKILNPIKNIICLKCARSLISKQNRIKSVEDIKFMLEINCSRKIQGFYKHCYFDKEDKKDLK